MSNTPKMLLYMILIIFGLIGTWHLFWFLYSLSTHTLLLIILFLSIFKISLRTGVTTGSLILGGSGGSSKSYVSSAAIGASQTETTVAGGKAGTGCIVSGGEGGGRWERRNK